MQEKSLVCDIKGKNVQKNKGKEGSMHDKRTNDHLASILLSVIF